MSWEAWSFVVLGAVLLGGFAWYERSRPPSQVVALVAALAALAVAGRLAFAAIPNVVATTDIAVFSGYAVGPAPGFAVGALAGLVSNFWLGQGPWTPWQMAAWGLCGVFGALLAWRGARMGRIGLAAACGFAGVAFGALMNFSLMATYGGELTLDRFAALEVRAIPFDAAHAIGNVTLALVAGPAMVRMLVRFRERFEWKERAVVRRPGGTGLRGGLATMLVLTFAIGALSAPAARAAGRGEGLSWLAATQNRDGGFPSSPGGDSSVSITGWAMLGLEAAGRNPLDLERRGRTPVDFLRRNSEAIGSSGDLAKTILALEGAGLDPRRFAGRNLVAQLRRRRMTNGSFENWPNATAFAVLALRAAGAREARLARSLRWLRRAQNRDGGWGVVPGSPSDADSTGAVLQAVTAHGSVRRAIRYLNRAQVRGGGFRLGGSGVVNSQSTAWAAQGMLAAGVKPSRIRAGGRDALDYLSARQSHDGHFRYSRQSDQTPIWVTAQALVPLYGDTYPLTPVPRAHHRHNKPSSDHTVGSSNPSTPPRTGAPRGSNSATAADPASDEGGAGAPPNRTQRERPASSGGDQSPPSRESRGGEGSGTAPTDTPEPAAVRGKPASAEIDPKGGRGVLGSLGIAAAIAAAATAVWWLLRRRYG
jgi:energy-coupling factor transport system substrate-specific component